MRCLVPCGVILFAVFLVMNGGLDRRIGVLAVEIFFGAVVLPLVLAAWANRRNLARLRRHLPARIRVVPSGKPAWRDPVEVARFAGELQTLGFRDIGCYDVEELPSTHIQVLDQPEQAVRARIPEQPGAKRPILRYDNSSSLTRLRSTKRSSVVNRRSGSSRSEVQPAPPRSLARNEEATN